MYQSDYHQRCFSRSFLTTRFFKLITIFLFAVFLLSVTYSLRKFGAKKSYVLSSNSEQTVRIISEDISPDQSSEYGNESSDSKIIQITRNVSKFSDLFFGNQSSLLASSYAETSDSFRTQFCSHQLKIENNPKICLYNAKEDIFISKSIISGGSWEDGSVRKCVQALRGLRASGEEPIFLDVGANLGVFSLGALSAGFATISVEPMTSAMTRLATSVELNRLSHLSKLVKMGVSDRRTCLKMAVNRSNKGGSTVREVNCTDSYDVMSITLDDLLEILPQRRTKVVMKMDIEGYEPFALASASRLFSTHDVRFLMMEWNLVKKILRENKDQNRISFIHRAVHFLNSQGFAVYHAGNLTPLTWDDYRNWSYDVIFSKDELN